MTVSVLRSMHDYVEHITRIEGSAAQTLVASSFLASHLFDKTTILRYFNHDADDIQGAHAIGDALWQRRRRIRANLLRETYVEIYELDAVTAFCEEGIVHRQDPQFRVTSSEIARVLETLEDLVIARNKYRVAFCREVLPFVFIAKTGDSLTLDVRNNFGYQRIQGLVIEEGTVCQDFEAEFWRIWNDSRTVNNVDEVLTLLRRWSARARSADQFIVPR